MSQARIVTDSAAELPSDVAESLGIVVVPWRIRMGAETLIDQPSLRAPDFYKRIVKERAIPVATPPSARQFSDAYAALAEETNDIVSIHTAGRMGRVVQAAQEGRGGFLGRCSVNVVDSQFISRALGVLVVEAAKAAQGGMPGAEIVRYVRGLMSRTYFVFYTETIDYLKRNSLFSPPPGVWNNTASFKPLLMLEDGEISALQRSRTRGTAFERLSEFVAEFPELKELTILRTGLGAEFQEFKAQLSEMFPKRHIEEHIYGPVLGALIGPAAIGLVAFEG